MIYIRLINRRTQRMVTIKASNILAVEDYLIKDARGLAKVAGSVIYINHKTFEVEETQEEIFEKLKKAVQHANY